MGMGLNLLLCAALAAEPEGGESAAPGALATRYSGWWVTQRSLVAADGALPDEDLDALLALGAEAPYDPRAVRQDIALLQRLLDARQVEVVVEEWPAFDAAGDPIPGVRVEYRVYSPLRVERVEVRGNRALSRREVLAALGREAGDAWVEGEAEARAEAVRSAYAERGWADATVEIATRPGSREGRVDLEVRVVEGRPRRLLRARVKGGAAISPGRGRWILWRNGVVPGRPLPDARIAAAREAVLERVRADGWYNARVSAVVQEGERGVELTLLVDPGRRFRVVVEGEDPPAREQVLAYARLEEGVRLASLGEAASVAVTEGLRGDGWLDADVTVVPEIARERVTLRVSGSRGPRYRLRSVTFTGAEALDDRIWSPRYLRGAFREASEDTLERRRVTPKAIEGALVALEEFYRAQGYLAVDFENLGEQRGRGRRVAPVDLRVRVVPGPRTTLDRVTVEGEAQGIDGDAFFADLVGRPLNPAALDARARRLVEAHTERGYLDADARVALEVDDDGRFGRARVVLEPGPEVYVRGVFLRGYRRARRAVIEREVDVRPGEPVVPSRLADIRRRLYDVGVFDRVSVEPVGDEDRAKDVVVTVEERPNWHFEMGGGLATDQGVRALLRGGHRNLWGWGHRLLALAEAGIGWQGDGWNLAWTAPIYKAALRYEAPHVPTRGERTALDLLLNEEQQEADFRLGRSGGALGVLLRLGEWGSAEVAYRVQARRLLDADPALLLPGDPWLDEVAEGADPFPSAVRAQSGVALSLVLDRRDDPFNPARGWVAGLRVDVADLLLSDITFVRGEGSLGLYRPMGPVDGYLRLRAGVGRVLGEGVLPVEDRFRLGGDGSFRGFALDAVGPANVGVDEDLGYPDALAPLLDYAGRSAAERWVATGGDVMGVGTVELQVPFERLGWSALAGTRLAVFTDLGNVGWLAKGVVTDSMAREDEPWIRGAWGFGVRRSTAIGPVAVDLGVNAAPLQYRDEPPVRLHLSLGAL